MTTLLTRSAALKAFPGLTRHALLAAERSGEVQAIRLHSSPTGSVRYRRADIESWLERCAHRPRPVAQRAFAAALARGAGGGA